MGPKKKLRSAKHNQSEQISDTAAHSAEPIVQSNDEVPSTYLLRLPNEVLVRIYQYLSPVDLISLCKVEQRLNELTFSIREANFSSCRRMSPQLVTSYFCRYRVKYIQKLNFNYNAFMKPYDLVRTICRCKNLVSLSVVECGVTHSQICRIIEECSKLEELIWNVKELSSTIKCNSNSLKRICLICDTNAMKHSCGLSDPNLREFEMFYESFQTIEQIFIIFAPDFLLGSPVMGMWSKSFFVSSDCPKKQVFVVNNSCCFNKVSCMVNRPPVDVKIFHSTNIQEMYFRHRLWDSRPYLAIRSTEKDISRVSAGPSDVYSSLLVYITSDILFVAESLANCISKVCGTKLNFLSLQWENLGEPICNMSYMLEKICLTCKNITVLDLSTIHFDSSPCKAICQLRNLKSLCLPSCAFKGNYNTKNWPKEQFITFQEVVSSCPNVVNFAFIHCSGHHITEDDVAPICNWKKLRQLSLYNAMFQTYGFLRNIARFCKKLESFTLITARRDYRCIFIYDVIYLLQTAKNLSFIRINSTKFNPMFERFWNSIGEASNLEGICLMTGHVTFIRKKEVLQAVRKLKKLHLFHFYAPGMSENLYTDVRKCMAGNGVVNIKLGYGNTGTNSELANSSFNHELPHFNCWDLHLNEIRF